MRYSNATDPFQSVHFPQNVFPFILNGFSKVALSTCCVQHLDRAVSPIFHHCKYSADQMCCVNTDREVLQTFTEALGKERTLVSQTETINADVSLMPVLIATINIIPLLFKEEI